MYSDSEIWDWPRYNLPELLVGPLPHKRNVFGRWMPDYDQPGVAQRVAVEVLYIEDTTGKRRRG